MERLIHSAPSASLASYDPNTHWDLSEKFPRISKGQTIQRKVGLHSFVMGSSARVSSSTAFVQVFPFQRIED